MEYGFLVVAALSGLIGLLLRRRVRRSVGRLVLRIGLAAVVVAFSIIALPLVGLWPFETLAAGLVAVTLLAIAAISLPFGIALGWAGRSDA